ncbi:MAG: hypothetical protein M0R80_18425 [Proteobacteria bacterium]|jgi:hypothetical protein|nr:hypothetical protein [Pseudomonadota bacterium]
MKALIFDVDGVLIEADDRIRIKKYRKLFKDGLKLAKSPDYDGSKWIFDKLKSQYDLGVRINPRHYKLINKNTAKILKKLSEKYLLCVTSWADQGITREKLVATGIWKYFEGGFIKGEELENGRTPHFTFFQIDEVVRVDDRPKKMTQYFIKFEYGQYKGQKCEADQYIENLEGLL